MYNSGPGDPIMSANFEDILGAALSLSPGARAMLADHLLESLDAEAQKKIDAVWAEEAERRAQAIDEGTAKLIPGDEVLAEMRSRTRE
jgi:putative addiction module component (TIGR02574 family)